MDAAVLLSVGPVSVAWNAGLGRLTFLAGAAIDDDGSGDPHGDPDFQARTSYRNAGPDGVPRWLNADLVPYIVLPPQVILAVPGIVLGCSAIVTNGANGLYTRAVVGDVGPPGKIGEMSIACARALGIDPSPTTGGEERRIIRYSVFPGLAADIGNVTYALQRYGT